MTASTNCSCPVGFGGRKNHWANCPWRRPVTLSKRRRELVIETAVNSLRRRPSAPCCDPDCVASEEHG